MSFLQKFYAVAQTEEFPLLHPLHVVLGIYEVVK